MTNVEFLRGLSEQTLTKVMKALSNERAEITELAALERSLFDDINFVNWEEIDLALAELRQTVGIIRNEKRG